MIKKRRRGTAIVETPKGILVVSGKSKIFLLPGGGANKGETRTASAIRELNEETGLTANYVKVLFRHVGKVHKFPSGLSQDHHTVCLVKAEGVARPKHEIKYIEYYNPASQIKLSGVTKEIIERFFDYKQKNKDYSK